MRLVVPSYDRCNLGLADAGRRPTEGVPEAARGMPSAPTTTLRSAGSRTPANKTVHTRRWLAKHLVISESEREGGSEEGRERSHRSGDGLLFAYAADLRYLNRPLLSSICSLAFLVEAIAEEGADTQRSLPPTALAGQPSPAAAHLLAA